MLQDYIFSLLTGYVDEPPAGVTLGEGQAYNPYFPGGALSMVQQLFNDSVQYEDGAYRGGGHVPCALLAAIKLALQHEYPTRLTLTCTVVV